jgi:hypothetical protein
MVDEKDKLASLETKMAVLETRFEAILKSFEGLIKTYEAEKTGFIERYKPENKAINDKLDSNAAQIAELRNDLKGKMALINGVKIGVVITVVAIFTLVKEAFGLVPLIKNLFNN